ncbi:MAG TPA: hypothetical protein VF041_00495 [Gemmatimonadaceae bacterium]
MTREPVVVAWSGGKDCMLALGEARRDPALDVVALLTTVTAEYDRVSMHGVRRSLLRAQAASLGVPLVEVEIPAQCTNERYEAAMDATLASLRAEHPALRRVVFGDLFLEDVRAYRERMLARAEMRGIYPVWGRDTRMLAQEVVALGVRAVVVCVDSHAIPAALVGREYDARFLRDLPATADPCGENGEFHTFVYDGPGFVRPVAHTRGALVTRDERFVFADLLAPEDETASAAAGAGAGAGAEPAANEGR